LPTTARNRPRGAALDFGFQKNENILGLDGSYAGCGGGSEGGLEGCFIGGMKVEMDFVSYNNKRI
jgi:hypothetical protein